MYTVRKEAKDVYQIAKFGERKEAEAVYFIRKNKCSCPAGYRKACKHIDLVKAFENLSDEGVWSFEFDKQNNVQPYYLRMFDLS